MTPTAACRARGLAAALLAGSLGAACVHAPMLEYGTNVPAQTMSTLDAPPVQDGRARFRVIFCDLFARKPDPRFRRCDEVVHRLSDEPAPQAAARPLPQHDPRLTLLIVPGLLSDCTKRIGMPFETSLPRLHQLGYRAEIIPVSGRSGTRHNAAIIAQYVRALPPSAAEQIVLIGHSKGAVDILEFVVSYPELSRNVAAVVSVSGSINGSPLGEAYEKSYNRVFGKLDVNACAPGDGKGMRDLTRRERFDWLATHPLPSGIRYFSLVAFTSPDSLAIPFRSFGAALAEIDPRSDGLLLFYDQVIPGATLLGYANADHWAVAVPVEEKRPLLATLVTRHNYYPRDALFEAVVLFVAEQLSAGSP